MRLGIIGGLGPMATAYFMELLINMTDAKCDQDHLEMIIYNCPSIPDRTAYILGKSNANPVVPIIKIGKKLKKQNVDCISIPCITAHYFHDEIEEKTGCKVMHAIRDTSYMLKEAGLTKIGIMATDGTIQSRIFQNEIEKNGMHGLVPDKKYQRIVMDIIYKDIETEVECKMLKRAINQLPERERIIVDLRFGLSSENGEEKTQKEVADMLGISQSYISRLEKKIMRQLRKEMVKSC